MPEPTIPPATVEFLKPLLAGLAKYHRYEISGFEHVPATGGALLVFTHSLATYDILLFGAEVYLKKRRLIASLADRLIFKTPVLREVAKHVGALEGEPKAARALLDAGRLVGVAPGGMREALRPWQQRYTVDWQRRTGFARLALEAQVPVILAACPAADEAYQVIDNPLTRFVYERFRIPLPLAIGRGIIPLPRPAHFIHYVHAPLHPPKIAGEHATRAKKRSRFMMFARRRCRRC